MDDVYDDLSVSVQYRSLPLCLMEMFGRLPRLHEFGRHAAQGPLSLRDPHLGQHQVLGRVRRRRRCPRPARGRQSRERAGRLVRANIFSVKEESQKYQCRESPVGGVCT